MGVTVGSSCSQTSFEVLALVLAVELWCQPGLPTVILGDNLGALQEALDLRGKRLHRPLAQALAVLRSRRSLDITVAHLPSESNTAADALSRLTAPGSEAKSWPFSACGSVQAVNSMKLSDLWSLLA